MKKDRVGEAYLSNEGYKMTIIAYNGAFDCDIQFDSGLILKNLEFNNIKRGAVKNPFHPYIFNIGYLGKGNYKSRVDKKDTVVYTTWRNMMARAYTLRYQEKHPTYISCSVDERWHNFQVFAEWFEKNYIEGWELDKDILVKGNKIYSPETCCFVPKEINYLFIKCDSKRGKYPIGVTKIGNRFTSQISKGVNGHKYLGLFKTPEEAFRAYKKEKEDYARELADKWVHKISIKVYNALIKYKVEIND